MNGKQHSSTHPPTPHPQEDSRFDRLRLLRSYRVGISTYRRLLKEHGSAKAALDALPEVARAAGVAKYQPFSERSLEAELKAGKNAGAVLVDETEPEYPSQLTQLDDAPPFLWTIGTTDCLKAPIIALVGARNASSLGTRMAKRLAAELGEAGFVIVSGLARGIDTAAHLASLETGTVAVQAGGVDVIYPAENSQLAKDIAERGLRLSEMPIGLQPMARHFPTRNRIISGMAKAVVVVEAASKSGSLITAKNALDQGRDVLAIPGHPFDARAAGCNQMIRDGAILVRSAKDVIEAIEHIAPPAEPELPMPPAERSLRDTNKLHQDILARLGPSPMAEDQLIRDLKAPAKGVAPILVELEMSGQVIRQPGGLLSKAVS